MKELHEVKYNFQQKQFLKQIDPAILAKAAVAIGKAKAEFHRSHDEEVRKQQRTWTRQAVLMQKASTISMKKEEAEYNRLRVSMNKREEAPDWSRFEGYSLGSNPRFYAPNFFNIGYGRSAGGVNTYDLWNTVVRGRLVRAYSSPTYGLMGVQISTANPGGQASFNTGLANFFFSQSAQTIPLSASFIVYGGGFSVGFGLGYSRAWRRLGVDAWVSGPAHPTPLHYYFVNDFWSSVPSPWVAQYNHFDYEAYSTGTHTITLQPGDLVFGSAVIEQGSVCGGLFTGSKSEFQVSVAPLQIGP